MPNLFYTGRVIMHEKNQLNPVAYNQAFQQVFKDRTIKLIAPGSGINPLFLEKIRLLSHLNIQMPDNLIEKLIAFHSNSDVNRYKLLKTALFGKSKKTVIWALRGGYGAARLIDKLTALSGPKQEKIFIGFSDVTALHLFLSQHWGWYTIHGAGLAELVNLDNDPQNLQKIAEIIEGKTSVAQINHLKPFNALAAKVKKISGRLTGGNLSIIQTSVGTNWQIKTTNKIVFLEDTNEKGYRIDRILNHLKQARIFNKVKAIIFGHFVDPKDGHVEFALERFANEINIPTFKTEQFGHGKTNYPLIYNAKSDILLSEGQTFELNMRLEKYN
jgi:muramoyltetrapeptide carboxypeptidase